MNEPTLGDELRALDDEQMEVDIERHRVGPNVWFWLGKQFTQAEVDRVREWAGRRYGAVQA